MGSGWGGGQIRTPQIPSSRRSGIPVPVGDLECGTGFGAGATTIGVIEKALIDLGTTHQNVRINNPGCVVEDLSCSLLELAIASKRGATQGRICAAPEGDGIAITRSHKGGVLNAHAGSLG